MDRKEFLQLVGKGAASAFFLSCLTSCSKDDVSAPTNVDFTIDLTKNLLTNGSYLVQNGVIVAKTSSGNYIAFQAACSHEGQQLVYTGAQFYCSKHGAQFSNTGSVTSGPTSVNLKQYNTLVTGTNLRVYS
jgi:cytochrome b6-f complex iron-sulfur subunit